MIKSAHPIGDEPPHKDALFQVGQIVAHRRYHYRGVVVEFDRTCQADESWYQSNQTQPDRAQPWYHVLVHGSYNITYAAQENLEAAEDTSPIDHPLVAQFFFNYSQGRYLRNQRPWPKV